MATHTEYLMFNTKNRYDTVHITNEVADIVAESGVVEGMCLVSAMHITAGVYVNDLENGLIEDIHEWLEKLTGEDNGDAHLKRILIGHQVIVPITEGKLDLGRWEQIFYAEFDGLRKKRVIVKVMGER